MLNSACRRFYYHRRDGSGMTLGNNQAVDACALSASNDGTQIMRILYAVRDDQERRFSFFFSDSQQIIHRAVFYTCYQRHYALMYAASRKAVQFLAGNLHHGNACLFGFRNNERDRAFPLTALHKQLVQGFFGFQSCGI